MPLPEEGNAIGFDDINEELGNNSTAELDLESASEQFGLTAPHGMNELFGLSLDNFATSITKSPSSIVSASAGGQTSTITYTSDGNFKINDDNISFATVSLGSGSEGTDNTFDIVIQAQDLDATSRTGNITLESPELTTQTISVHQDDNDAILTIVRQTGIMTYGHNGGEGEYYKIETSPEDVVTWVASIAGASGFYHRIYNSGDSFTQSNISGTGDEFIEVKSDANSTSSDKTATVTVDPQNISDPNATDTVRVQKEPTFSVSPANEVGGVWYSTSNFTYDDSSYSDRINFTVTSNYDIDTVTSSNSNFTATKNSNSSFYVHPDNANSSTSQRSTNITVSLNSLDTSTHTVNINQGGAPAITATLLTDPPGDWNYNQSGTGQYKDITGQVTNNINSSAITFSLGNTSEWRFVDTYQTSIYTYTYVEMGSMVVANQASVQSPGNGSYIVRVYPVSNNTGTSNKTNTLTFTAGSSSDTTTLTQLFQTVWTASPSSLSFVQSGETKNITLNTSHSWTAAISGTGFSLGTTSGVAGTHTIGVTAISNSGGARTGTVTISASGQTDHTISLSQAGADSNLDVSWNNGFSYEEGGDTSTLTLSNNSSQYREYNIYARQDYGSTVTWSINYGTSYAEWNTGSGTSTSDQTATVGTTAVYKTLRVLANSSSGDVSFQVEVTSTTSTDTYIRTYTHTGTGSGGSGGDGPSEEPQL